MIVLGIETSCDETAAAVLSDRGETPGERILANCVLSQHEAHRPYGGIVPEIAARAHLTHIDRLVGEAMNEAGIEFTDLDGVAVTGGPGLIGGVMVGVMTAKAIALAHDLPFLAINHLEGHALTVRLTENLAFPYLLLLVSGGHCQLLSALGVGKYRRLGTTLDDAIGEAFDKAAKMLGLGYPGGPLVEKAALAGDGSRFDLPRPMLGRPNCHFSFSGLKTALRQVIARQLDEAPSQADISDLCATFQDAVGDVLVDRCAKGLGQMRDLGFSETGLVVAGGVAANRALGARLSGWAEAENIQLAVPPPAIGAGVKA